MSDGAKGAEGADQKNAGADGAGSAGNAGDKKNEGAQGAKGSDNAGGKPNADGGADEQSESLLGGAGEDDADGKQTDGEGDQGKPNKDAPADYEFKLPEGVDPKSPMLGKFKELAKELKLDGAHAQKVVDFYIGEQQAQEKAKGEQINAERSKWVEALKTDKEFGGDNYAETKARCAKVMKACADQELRKFLDASGFGDFPPLVKFVARVGAKLSEDSLAGGQGAPPKKEQSEEAVYRSLYPSMYRTQTEAEQ